MRLGSEAERRDTAEILLERSLTAKIEAYELALEKGIPFSGTIGNRRFELIRLENGQPLYYIEENANAAISTGADRLRQTAPYNTDGTSLTVGVWDSGPVKDTHQEFGSRITVIDTALASSYHATHVAGTIAASGVVAAAKGMAPNALIDSYDWNSDTSEMTARAASAAGQAGKIYISNHSYGYINGWEGAKWYGTYGEREDAKFGRYGPDALDWDALCFAAPYFLPFKSAGNDRNDSAPAPGATFTYAYKSGTYIYNPASDPYDDFYDNGFDTVSSIATAKNILCIGAVDDAVSGGVRNVSAAYMASFSGWGPTDDGRIKPDIVANGVNVYSAYNTTNASYATMSGTSMATPNAAGSALLLIEYYGDLFPGQAMRSSTLKALILHTADDLGNAGPDYSFGWGLMNVRAAADHIAAHYANANLSKMVEAALDLEAPTDTYTFTWDGSNPIRATLCWTDPAFTSARSSLDDPTIVLRNDLDMRLTVPGGAICYPYILDPANPAAAATTGDNVRDNVEQIELDLPTTGTYTISISHKNSLVNGVQSYALMLDGQALDDLSISPLETYQAEGGKGGPFWPTTHTYTLTNDGASTLTWSSTPGATWLAASPSSGTLAPAAATTVSVSIAAAANELTTGSYAGIVYFQNDTSGVKHSRNVALTVRLPILYAFNMDTDPGWTAEALWAYGQPTGGGGQHGSADPTLGYTGQNVYGYNLDGDYENNLIGSNLATLALDFTDYDRVYLGFRRWLGVEAYFYDLVFLEISTDGAAWETIWMNLAAVIDSEWNYVEYDISSYAAGEPTVYIRWVQGQTDSSDQYCGWNLDDVWFMVAYPEAAVEYAGSPVADSGGPLDLGSTPRGGAPIQAVFTVRNTGTDPLLTSDLTVTGTVFSIAEGLDATIPPNASDTFTLEVDSTTSGTHEATVSFTSNDLDENPYNFTVTATVVGWDPDSEVWVSFGYVGTEQGTQSEPYNTLSEGVDAALEAGTIRIETDSTSETIRITKNVRLDAPNGRVRIGG